MQTQTKIIIIFVIVGLFILFNVANTAHLDRFDAPAIPDEIIQKDLGYDYP